MQHHEEAKRIAQALDRDPVMAGCIVEYIAQARLLSVLEIEPRAVLASLDNSTLVDELTEYPRSKDAAEILPSFLGKAFVEAKSFEFNAALQDLFGEYDVVGNLSQDGCSLAWLLSQLLKECDWEKEVRPALHKLIVDGDLDPAELVKTACPELA